MTYFAQVILDITKLSKQLDDTKSDTGELPLS